jgi:hypothetical protein
MEGYGKGGKLKCAFHLPTTPATAAGMRSDDGSPMSRPISQQEPEPKGSNWMSLVEGPEGPCSLRASGVETPEDLFAVGWHG